MPFRRKQLTQEKLYVPGYILGDITLDLALSTTLPFYNFLQNSSLLVIHTAPKLDLHLLILELHSSKYPTTMDSHTK